MNTLGVNTIRVYTVESTQNHDGCMQAFESQGIYVWVDLSSPMHAINRVSNAPIACTFLLSRSQCSFSIQLSPAWTVDLYNNWTATMDAFSGYDNLLFFTISNEVISDESKKPQFHPTNDPN